MAYEGLGEACHTCPVAGERKPLGIGDGGVKLADLDVPPTHLYICLSLTFGLTFSWTKEAGRTDFGVDPAGILISNTFLVPVLGPSECLPLFVRVNGGQRPTTNYLTTNYFSILVDPVHECLF